MITNKITIAANLKARIKSLGKSATLEINERTVELSNKGKKIYRLGFGQSPFPVPPSVVEALRANASQKDYLPVQGLLQLREAISDFLKRTRSVNIDPEDIIVSPGSKELLFLHQVVFEGDILLPSPSWVSYAPQGIVSGNTVIWLNTKSENDWMIQPSHLEEYCNRHPDSPKTLILNYPSNPTGATLSDSTLEQIAEVCRAHEIIVIADEIYAELSHSGNQSSLAKFYPEGTIISSGLSKWCGAGGWRVGFFAFPPELDWLKNAITILASETYTSSSAPIQFASVKAYEFSQEVEDQLNLTCEILKYLGAYLFERLSKMQIHCPRPAGGFYLFPNFKDHSEFLRQKGVTSSVDLCNFLLDETGIALLPGVAFGRPPEDLVARLSYVDFDGENALNIARTYSKEFNEEFLKLACPRILEAFEVLEEWLK